MEATVPSGEVSKEMRELRALNPVKVPKTARSGWKGRRWCIGSSDNNKTVVRGTKRGRDRVRV